MPAKTRLVTLDALKGIAILAVLALHYWSSVDRGLYTTHPHRWFYITLNCFTRFSVPLFVAVSGFVNASSSLSHYSTRSFLMKRFIHLLPPYVGWSLVIFTLFSLSPEWAPFKTPFTITHLFLGDIDYHLYFIPMLLGLTLTVPIIYRLRRYLPLLLLLSLALQIVLSYQLSSLSDQEQYRRPAMWIFYYVLGWVLATSHYPRIRFPWSLVLTLSWFMSFLFAVYQTITLQQSGIDIIIASRFTQLPLMLYATLTILFAFWLIGFSGAAHLFFVRMLASIGRYSLLIYLSHTLILRVLVQEKVPLSLMTTITTLIITSVAIILTLMFEYHLVPKLVKRLA